MTRWWCLLLCCCFCASEPDARATTTYDVKFAVLVGNHSGARGATRLRYAGRDVERMQRTLRDVGGFKGEHVLTLIDERADHVALALAEMALRIEEVHDRGQRATLLFYYSGHADKDALQLGRDLLSLAAVREGVAATHADLRLLVIDSCAAGAFTNQEKGTDKGNDKGAYLAPLSVQLVAEALPRGQVIITSSAASEASQESDDIQGSYFTYYWTSALRGAADTDDNHRITLSEAYRYTFDQTILATALTASGIQHPNFDFDVAGQGDIELADLTDATVTLALADELSGRIVVVDLEHERLVAEVNKHSGTPSHVTVPPGRYALKISDRQSLRIATVTTQQKGTHTVVANDFVVTAPSEDFAKGSPIHGTQTAVPAYAIDVGIGAHGMLDVVDNGNLFPSTPLADVSVSLLRLWQSPLTLSLSVGAGRVDATRTIAFDDTVLRYPIAHTQVETAAALYVEQPLLSDQLRLFAGPRFAATYFDARFDKHAPVERQSYFTFGAGVEAGITWIPFWDARLSARVRASAVPYTVDDTRILGSIDGLVTIGWEVWP